jgi:hypothetical protein
MTAFGEHNVRWDFHPAKGRSPDFPVLPKVGAVVSAKAISDPLALLPAASFDYVFVDPKLHARATQWLKANRCDILTSKEADHE